TNPPGRGPFRKRPAPSQHIAAAQQCRALARRRRGAIVSAMLILATLIAAAQPAAQPAAEPAAEPAPEPANVAVSEETGELAFDYAWPAAAERDPALAAELRRRRAAARR